MPGCPSKDTALTTKRSHAETNGTLGLGSSVGDGEAFDLPVSQWQKAQRTQRYSKVPAGAAAGGTCKVNSCSTRIIRTHGAKYNEMQPD